jgi:hypothetical protein
MLWLTCNVEPRPECNLTGDDESTMNRLEVWQGRNGSWLCSYWHWLLRAMTIADIYPAV